MSIIAKNLTKTFGKQNAIDDISFEVKSGEIVGFLGPNGAGKSTTMKIATCYWTPTRGTIEVAGFDAVQSSMKVRKNIGYLPEHNPLYLDMYVREYLAFVGHLHSLRGKKLRQRIDEMVELCGLTRERKKKIASLSKGYRQRVGLAQAMIHNPPVLILDEPTTGLDPNQIVEIRQLIKNLGKEKTVLFSTHIMQEVQAICDRAIIINLGKIVADSDVDSLKNLQESSQKLIIEFESEINVEVLKQIEGIEIINKTSNFKYEVQTNTKRDIRPEISKVAGQEGWILLGMQKVEQSLESVFQNLTKS